MVWPTKLIEYECSTVLPEPTPAVTKLEHLIELKLDMPSACTRLTAIMATVSPATCEPTVLKDMMAAGMNMARINASFDTMEKRAEMVKSLRSAAQSYGQMMGYFYPLTIALDLCGPVIRTGLIDYGLGERLYLKTGDELILTTDENYREKGTYHSVYVDYTNFSFKVKKGQAIYIDNELLKLNVESVEGCTVTCIIERGGELLSQRDVKIPGVQIDLPTFSERDKEDINFAVHQQVDMIIASYVERGESIKELRNLLDEKGKRVAIACKIQSLKALDNLDELIKESDSVIIARQELGTDINAEKLILAQKNIASRAMAVFHSMNSERIPLRSEVMDAGNSVLDGADYLLLSAETASGPRPVEAVAMLAEVLKEAEKCVWLRRQIVDLIDTVSAPCRPDEGVTLAGALASIKFGAVAVIITTTSGSSAATMSRFRPRCPVLAVTRHSSVARQLHLHRGVVPLLYEGTPDPDWSIESEQRIKYCCRFGVARGIMKLGDPVVVISGWKTSEGFINTLRYQTVEADVEGDKKN